ncbi:hypothetical protein LTR70_002707 [Exophiala xenobiotica]|uniref:Uncharacterized protein n=1 Tax=Lithohypha guttulata TaxID=1690604 RepID=A0ABR0KJL4_9EURO|nr:hypothetical protein LTR24_001813 [Lithohypha guttulata]KAK5324633.1 hypothetical protein LTR70_002707 [Exophiala xenobiotica]
MSVEAKLSKLSLNLKNTNSPRGSNTNLNGLADGAPDSWEDEVSEDGPVDAPGPSLKQVNSIDDGPGPPPPTPISAQNTDPLSRGWETSQVAQSAKPTPRNPGAPRDSSEKRPEKTASTANRMIAGALGIKAPKKSEEQKQYDNALRQAEIKRKNREREQRELDKLEDEKAKAAVWTD